MKKIVTTSCDNHGAFIAIGIIEPVVKPNGSMAFRFQGEVEVRIVFTLAQAEAMLREYESEVVPEHAVEAYQTISRTPWANRTDAPPAVKLRGEAARFLIAHVLTALYDPNIRRDLERGPGEWGRLIARTVATSQTPRVDTKDTSVN